MSFKIIRKIVEINEERCVGCGKCVNACHEGAIKMVNGKARLSADHMCDGLGACIGECPYGAISIIERESDPFDQSLAASHPVPPPAAAAPTLPQPTAAEPECECCHHHGSAVNPPSQAQQQSHSTKVTLSTMGAFGASDPASAFQLPARTKPLACGCPGSMMRSIPERVCPSATAASSTTGDVPSRLTQWPVQIRLVPANAPFLNGADVLIAADCTAYAFGNFHQQLLAGKKLLIGCPKLDDLQGYLNKFTEMFLVSNIHSVTVVRMEVPCCTGLAVAAKQALVNSGKAGVIPYEELIISVDGRIIKNN